MTLIHISKILSPPNSKESLQPQKENETKRQLSLMKNDLEDFYSDEIDYELRDSDKDDVEVEKPPNLANYQPIIAIKNILKQIN